MRIPYQYAVGFLTLRSGGLHYRSHGRPTLRGAADHLVDHGRRHILLVDPASHCNVSTGASLFFALEGGTKV